MTNLKTSQRIADAIEEKIPLEDLSDEELDTLAKLVFDAVLFKLHGATGSPISNEIH